LTGIGLSLGGCRPWTISAAPSVEITQVPPADPGGTSRISTIEGRATGTRPGQRIVLYARSGAWWIQPFADRPFTAVEADSTWKSSTHLGTEYAALLVDPEYRPAATLGALPGTGSGVVALARVDGAPAFWRTRAFLTASVLAALVCAWALHRFRMHQLARQLNIRFEERLADRTRIAQHLYDTLLQGFLSASMQLHVALDQLPERSPERTRLDRVLRMMGEVTEEGRQVLQGLRSDVEADRLEDALSRINDELGVPDTIGFRMTVRGQARRLHPIFRDEVYRVGREALLNAFRHSQARGVEVEIEYSARVFRLLVRDDGGGIDAEAADPLGDAGRRLAGMRQRAQRMGGRLRVRAREGAGTEVELSVPSGIAFPAGVGPRHASERTA
jgi:signal transduction histidine kinase